MLLCDGGAIKAESCLRMERGDNKRGNTTGSIPQHLLVFSHQRDGVTEIEALGPDGEEMRFL